MSKMSRMISSLYKWTDKDCPHHKHDFSQEVVIVVNNRVRGKALKCRYCRSFRECRVTSDSLEGLPVCRFVSPHKYRIDLLDLEPEGD